MNTQIKLLITSTLALVIFLVYSAFNESVEEAKFFRNAENVDEEVKSDREIEKRVKSQIVESRIKLIPASVSPSYDVDTENKKTLKVARDLIGTSLLGELEKSDLETLLMDQEQLSWAISKIRGESEKVFALESELLRMDVIVYLDAALEWKGNPSKNFLIGEVKTLLSEYEPNPNLSERLRRSFAADHAELSKSLYMHEEDKALELEAELNGTKGGAIMNFARNFYFMENNDEKRN